MSGRDELERTLAELRELTGLSVAVPADTDEAEAAARAAQLLEAWKKRYSRDAFLRAVLLGQAEEAETEKLAARFHVPAAEDCRLYLIETAGEASAAQPVLKNLFLERQHDMTVEVSRNRLVLLRTLRRAENEETARETAETIVDMLGAEAQVRARVGWGSPAASIEEFPVRYREAVLALEVGRIFMGDKRAISYAGLGVGRLLYKVPQDACRLYLKESVGGADLSALDEETRAIIRTFFAHNLNLSETARKLYLHRNTLVYRIEKLHQLTGLDLRIFDEAMQFKIAMMVTDCLKARDKETKEDPLP